MPNEKWRLAGPTTGINDFFIEDENGIVLARIGRDMTPERREQVRAALEEMLKYGQHEGPCDNADPETGIQWEGAAACDLHIAASEAREKIARAALARARGESPDAK
jgi:hypothetical protein